MKKTNRIFKKVTILGWALSATLASGCQYFQPNYYNRLLKTVKANPKIKHALGGIDGYIYLDTLEALEQNYELGYRFFEADVNFTSDNELVLVHGWRKIDYERIGVTYDPDHPIPTLAEFLTWQLQGAYPTTSFKELVGFMKAHKDVFVLLDFGQRTYDATLTAYTAVVSDANRDDSILQRFIVGGHTPDMIAAVKAAYDFKLMLLYVKPQAKRAEQIKTLEQFASYCQDNDIKLYSVSLSTYTNEDVKNQLADANLTGFVFTSDDQKVIDDLVGEGIGAVGTNFL